MNIYRQTGRLTDKHTTYIHTYIHTCTYTDKQMYRWTVYLVAGGLSSAQSFLVMALRQAQLWILTKQGGPIGQRDRQTDRTDKKTKNRQTYRQTYKCMHENAHIPLYRHIKYT
jgi:hypothetical protein